MHISLLKGHSALNHSMNGVMVDSPRNNKHVCETCCIPMQADFKLLFYEQNESLQLGQKSECAKILKFKSA